MELYPLQTRVHRKFAVEEGDHLTMLNVYEAFIKVSTATLGAGPTTHTPTLTSYEQDQKLVHKHLAGSPLCFPVR